MSLAYKSYTIKDRESEDRPQNFYNSKAVEPSMQDKQQ